jgi:hypothetical protein
MSVSRRTSSTIDDSVLRTEMGELESQGEDDPRVSLSPLLQALDVDGLDQVSYNRDDP